MQAAAQQLADSIVSATAVTHNPASSQQSRAEAVAFFEQVPRRARCMLGPRVSTCATATCLPC